MIEYELIMNDIKNIKEPDPKAYLKRVIKILEIWTNLDLYNQFEFLYEDD